MPEEERGGATDGAGRLRSVGRVPITVLTGFLGAGKTTLLQSILHGSHGKRVLVVQNEFSDEMGIESPLLLDTKGGLVRDLFELPNGCMCCSVRDEIVAALDSVLAEFPDRFTHIVVEASGVADPLKLIPRLWVDADLDSKVFLDGIVGVLDLANLEQYLGLTRAREEPGADVLAVRRSLAEHPSEPSDDEQQMEEADRLAALAEKQIAAASVLLLNKCDLIPAEALDEHVRFLQSEVLARLNPCAPILRCTLAQVPLDQILNLEAFNVPDAATLAIPTPSHSSSHIGGHGSPHSSSPIKGPDFSRRIASNAFISVTVPFHLSKGSAHNPRNCHAASLVGGSRWISDAPFIWTLKDATAAIGEIVWEWEPSRRPYRYKGLFPVRDGDQGLILCALQGVAEIFSIEPVQGTECVEKMLEIGSIRPDTNPNGLRYIIDARLLFVGRDLDAPTLRNHIKSRLLCE